MKVRRILLDEYKERLRRSQCPRCKKFSLQKLDITPDIPTPTSRYRLTKSYWACSGPAGFSCYFMSDIQDTTMFESAEGVDLIDFTEENVKSQPTKIVRRRKGECVSIVSQL